MQVFLYKILNDMQVSGDNFIKERAFSRLTSRDSNKFWTAGQWMTERRGGSDVGK